MPRPAPRRGSRSLDNHACVCQHEVPDFNFSWLLVVVSAPIKLTLVVPLKPGTDYSVPNNPSCRTKHPSTCTKQSQRLYRTIPEPCTTLCTYLHLAIVHTVFQISQDLLSHSLYPVGADLFPIEQVDD